jgi:hypothetical protein
LFLDNGIGTYNVRDLLIVTGVLLPLHLTVKGDTYFYICVSINLYSTICTVVILYVWFQLPMVNYSLKVLY